MAGERVNELGQSLWPDGSVLVRPYAPDVAPPPEHTVATYTDVTPLFQHRLAALPMADMIPRPGIEV